MKTAHQLASELLAGPDLPIWHFDPSRAGLDAERDTSLGEPEVEENDAAEGLDEEQIAEAKEERCYTGKFLTICGETDAEGEAKSEHEVELEDLLRSACAIAERKGAGTAWDRFTASAAKLGLNGITARTYRVLPSDLENHRMSHDEK